VIRPLTVADLPACMRLKEAAGWNQTEADWRALLELEPAGCWGYEVDGLIAGSTSVVRYGDELAWIGMVLTLPEYRRRGIARALMQHALADCETRGVECIKLDATDLGRPLYLSLGFEDERAIERWSGVAPSEPPGRIATEPGTLEAWAALDRRAFGADRRRLLERLGALPDCAASFSDAGFALTRPGSEAPFLGPCVADSPEIAEDLIRGVLTRRPGERFYWDLLPGSSDAVATARRLGFEPRRRLVRMAKGAGPSGQLGLIYATAGFEYG